MSGGALQLIIVSADSFIFSRHSTLNAKGRDSALDATGASHVNVADVAEKRTSCKMQWRERGAAYDCPYGART